MAYFDSVSPGWGVVEGKARLNSSFLTLIIKDKGDFRMLQLPYAFYTEYELLGRTVSEGLGGDADLLPRFQLTACST